MPVTSSSSGIKPGTLAPYAGGTIPEGWLECGGQEVSRSTYAALFLAIGTIYGPGDGVTTFNLPDARGRSLIGKDDMGGTAANRVTTDASGLNAATLGAVGGGQTITIAKENLPAYYMVNPLYGWTSNDNYNHANSQITGPKQSGAGYLGNQGQYQQGGGLAVSRMQPSIVVNTIIKT